LTLARASNCIVRPAEAIESTRDTDQHLASLGQHWEQAGEPGKARSYSMKGADQARESGYAYAEAERLFRATLRPQPDIRCPVASSANQSGEILHTPRGDWSRPWKSTRGPLLEARELGDRAIEGRSLLRIGVNHQRSGQVADATQLYNEALAIARELDDQRDEAMALLCLGLLQLEQGRFESARAILTEALRISRAIGDRRLRRRAARESRSLLQRPGDCGGARPS
jgi:tetratricopeptide (TPR) repeat protein